MLREGDRDAGVCMHKRKLALATKIRGLCGCKRRIEIILHYKKRIRIFEEFIIVFQTDGCVNIYNGDTHGVVMNMVYYI